MSRSRKKISICGATTGRSEKHDKRIANRIFRRKEKAAIHHEKDPPENINEVSDIWLFDKDGKFYFDEEWPKRMRK